MNLEPYPFVDLPGNFSANTLDVGADNMHADASA